MSTIRFVAFGLVAGLMMVLPVATQEPIGKRGTRAEGMEPPGSAEDDARLLAAAGLSVEGPGLLDLFRGRARGETKPGEIDELLQRFQSKDAEERVRAGTELVVLGPLAVPSLRKVANDLDGGEAQVRARKLLNWTEGPQSATLVAAAARMVARRQPAGAAQALLAYLPCADNEDVSTEVVAALKSVAIVDGRPDPALVRALSDPMPLRRATAGAVLGHVGANERKAVEKLLADDNAEVRLVAAMGLARANHAAAVPVLIDLLPVLPVQKRDQVDAFLQELAGEWAPVGGPMTGDEIALRVRKAAWGAWWNSVDGPALLELLRKRMPSAEEQEKIKQAIARLGDASFQVRENAVIELTAKGRMILPLLRDALKDRDPEIAYRAQQCLRRIEEGEPAKKLPQAALRLLALRNPPGAAETLIAFLPFTEEEQLPDLHSALAVVALQDGKPAPALLKALSSARPAVRGAAGEALAKGNSQEALTAARKLLTDNDVAVRLRVGQALAARDARAVAALIALMAEVNSDQAWQIHEFLCRLAGERAPQGPSEDTAEARKFASAAWAAWWKGNAEGADLTRFNVTQSAQLGYTVICEYNSGIIVELGRDHKPRWSFGGTIRPIDVWALPNNRVLVAEYDGNRVTERDTKGNIIWQKQTIGFPRSCQRLPNGNTLITCHQPDSILEVDRQGKEVVNINNLPQRSLTGAYKGRNGQIVCIDESGMCTRLDATGKQLSSFNTRGGLVWLDLLPNGHVLASFAGLNKVAEYDLQGKVIFEMNVNNITAATGLPNGNLLIACNPSNQVMEMDRKGQVIWEYKSQGPFRARGR